MVRISCAPHGSNVVAVFLGVATLLLRCRPIQASLITFTVVAAVVSSNIIHASLLVHYSNNNDNSNINNNDG